MAKLLVVLAVAALAATIYAIVDCLLTENDRVRGIPKPVWVIVMILLPVIGALLWFTIGKDRTPRQPAPRPLAPDDDPAFLSRLEHTADQDERIRLLEERLAELDDESGDDRQR